MKWLRWLIDGPKPQGPYPSEESLDWAAERFSDFDQNTSALVGEILCEQTGLKLEQIYPDSKFIEDLKIDEETVEVVMAFEEEFDIEIPVEAAERLSMVKDLIVYLIESTSEHS